MFITDLKSIEKVGKDYKISGSLTITVPASNKMAIITNGVAYLATPDKTTVENNQVSIAGTSIPVASILAIEIPTQLKKTSIMYFDFVMSDGRFMVDKDTGNENFIFIMDNANRRVKLTKHEKYFISTGIYFKEITIEDFEDHNGEIWIKTENDLINVNRIFFIGDPVV